MISNFRATNVAFWLLFTFTCEIWSLQPDNHVGISSFSKLMNGEELSNQDVTEIMSSCSGQGSSLKSPNPENKNRFIRSPEEEAVTNKNDDSNESSTIIPITTTATTNPMKEEVPSVSITSEDILLDSVCGDDDQLPPQCENNAANETSVCQILKKMKKKEKLFCQLFKRKSEVTRNKDPLDDYLPKDYNRFEVPIINFTYTHPNGTTEPVNEPVGSRFFLNIREVRDLDETEEVVTLDMDIVVIWVDGSILKNVRNLSANPKVDFTRSVVLDPVVLQKIWSPDIYFEELVTISRPTLMGKPETIVLYPSHGLFVYRTRVLAKLNCPMEFTHYPADTQECNFNIKSFSYITKLFKMEWKSDAEGTGIYLHELSAPNFDFQVSSYSQVELPQNFGPGTHSVSLYSTLKFTILARRKMSYHVVQTYMPSVFFVIVTWFCFLIPMDMFEARVGISMSTLLTLTAMFASVRESTPIVSYVKAIDIWMVMCIIFIFSALGAFITSAWVNRLQAKLEQEENSGKRPNWRESIYGNRETRKRRYKSLAKIVNIYPQIFLSLGYIIFNILYWSWLLVGSEHFSWHVNSSLNAVE